MQKSRTIKNTFHKQERLCSRKQMELLFSKGKSSAAYPLKLVYINTPVELIYPAQSMFVVPKRNHKRAHDRNKLKRRMREGYRLNKISLYTELIQKERKCLWRLFTPEKTGRIRNNRKIYAKTFCSYTQTRISLITFYLPL